MTPTDQELINRSLQGDTLAFDTLFLRYRAQLLVMLRQKCTREDMAEDILQETFIKSYMNLNRFDQHYTFGQWVYTIARNLFIDYTRRHKDPCVSLDRSVEMQTPSNAPTPEECFIAQQDGSQLNALLAQLPENYRIMAQMRFWQEYSYEEIALQLNMPVGTVKTQIFRARERLCKLIEQHDDHETKKL